VYFLGWQTTLDGLPKSLVKFKNPWTQLTKIDITMPNSEGLKAWEDVLMLATL
jgi:hypothetical protein